MRSDDASNTSNVLRIGAGLLLAGFIFSSILPLFNAGSSGPAGTKLLENKLSRVPVFTVTDSTGRPYLTETGDGKLRVGYFFVQPSDADRFLEKVRTTDQSTASSSPGSTGFDINDAKVLAISVDNVIGYLETSSSGSIRPAKSVPEKFQLFPDDHQFDVAQQLSNGKFKDAYGEKGVPVFFMDGLAFKDEATGGKVLPVFFEKEQLDKAITDLKQSNPDALISEEDLQIMDFLQTIKEIRAGADPRFQKIAFIPLNDAVNTLKTLNQ